MKEFLLLFRGGDTERKELSPEEKQAHMQRWQDWIGTIAQTGDYLGGQPLVPTGGVLQGPAKKLTDGPFIEGKEVLGGYVLLKSDGLENALKIAENCPNLEYPSGSVEVREVAPVHR